MIGGMELLQHLTLMKHFEIGKHSHVRGYESHSHFKEQNVIVCVITILITRCILNLMKLKLEAIAATSVIVPWHGTLVVADVPRVYAS